MRPTWHALTSLVPVYASFRAHAHFRALAETVRPSVPDTPDRAAWAAWMVSIAWLVSVPAFFTQGLGLLALAAVASGLYAVVVYQGQSDLNSYLRVAGGEQVPRAHALESIGLVLAVLYAVAYAYGVLQPVQPVPQVF